MRRLLLAFALALIVLPTADASAGLLRRDLSASFRNSTDQKVTLGFYDDGRYRRIVLDPGESVDDLTQNDSDMIVSLEDCGPSRLRMGNPGFGRPGVTLTADGGRGSDSDSFDVGERRLLRFQGVTVAALRQPDTKDDKNLDIDVRACRPTAEDTMSSPPEQTAGLTRNVRATVHNATADPVDVGYDDGNGRWRALRIAPGATSPSFGNNESTLMLVLSDCGPARLWFSNDALFAPSAAMWGERWVLPGRGLDVGESTTFSHDGANVAVTRGDDSATAKQFAVDLQAC